jgi:DNA transformation protein and related proteins
MAVSDGDLAFVLDQLADIGEVRAKRMFGGIGLYAGERFFGLMDDGVLYFKTDDATRARYTRRRMTPFIAPGEQPSKTYYRVPTSVLEDAAELVAWAREAVAVADRAAAKKTAKASKAAKAR